MAGASATRDDRTTMTPDTKMFCGMILVMAAARDAYRRLRAALTIPHGRPSVFGLVLSGGLIRHLMIRIGTGLPKG
jgi:hypothetical protein